RALLGRRADLASHDRLFCSHVTPRIRSRPSAPGQVRGDGPRRPTVRWDTIAGGGHYAWAPLLHDFPYWYRGFTAPGRVQRGGLDRRRRIVLGLGCRRRRQPHVSEQRRAGHQRDDRDE